MLPDYPKAKSRITKVFTAKIKQAHDSYLGPPFDFPPSQMHEGETNILHREDGSIDEIRPQKIGAKGELNLDIRNFEKLNLQEIDKLLKQLGEGLAGEKGKAIVAAVDNAVRSVGNVTDPACSPLDQFFQATEKISMEFDDDGKPMGMQFVVGSEETAQKLREVMRQIEGSPQLRSRYESIIERKRREWRDRETDRKLVD